MSILEQLQSTKSSLSGFAQAAMGRAIELGVPNKKNENWKYTNLEKYMPAFDLAEQSSFDLPQEPLDENFIHVFFANGELVSADQTLKLQRLNQDNEIDFKNVKEKMSSLLEGEFAFQMSDAQDKNQYLLEVEGEINSPLLIHNVYSGDKAKHVSAHIHVVAKKFSKCHIAQTHFSRGALENFANISASFYVEDGAKLAHTKIQALNNESSSVQNIRAYVCRDGHFESITVDVGGKLARNNISVKLDAEGANASAHGLYAIAGEQQADTNSLIRHAKGHTESSQLYKAIMADKAYGIFSGLIRMDKDAQLCNSEQLNKNLLLSKGAHAQSRPQLEIFADDVKASHGSTTGQLSEEELFYFQARGVSKEKAQKLLAQAFLNDVLLKIEDTHIRSLAQRIVAENFKALDVEA